MGIGVQKRTYTPTNRKNQLGSLNVCVCVRLKQAESACMFYLERKEKRNKKKKGELNPLFTAREDFGRIN